MLSIIILFLAYLVKGIYPFGDSNISYFDMLQLYIPSHSGTRYCNCDDIQNDILLLRFLLVYCTTYMSIY